MTDIEKIKELKSEIKAIREKNKFITFYRHIRYQTVAIKKDTEITEDQKKLNLWKLCKKVAEDIDASFDNESFKKKGEKDNKTKGDKKKK